MWREKWVFRWKRGPFPLHHSTISGAEASGKEQRRWCVSAVPSYNHADDFEIDFEPVKAGDCKMYDSCCSPTPTSAATLQAPLCVSLPLGTPLESRLFICGSGRLNNGLTQGSRGRRLSQIFSPRYFFQTHETWESEIDYGCLVARNTNFDLQRCRSKNG